MWDHVFNAQINASWIIGDRSQCVASQYRCLWKHGGRGSNVDLLHSPTSLSLRVRVSFGSCARGHIHTSHEVIILLFCKT